MIRWLEDNPLGIVLASVCGGLLVISLLLAVIWALPASSPSAGPEGENTVPDLELPELAVSESIDEYAVITEHPVFNNTRLPVIEDDVDDLEDELSEEEVDAPDVQLTGVIITPSIRMATLRQEGEKLSLVSKIDYREVTLSSGAGEEIQLKLEVHGVAIAEPPKPEPAAAENERGKKDQVRQGEEQPLSRAEEIRQRIAERREELRRAAEEDEQGGQASYQQAIQAMMGKKRQEKSKNEKDN